jgi:hypothetical protein
MSLGGAEALVMSTVGQKGMGDVSDVLNIADKLTGGAVAEVGQRFDQLETYLKVSIACSMVAGAFALLNFLEPKRS